MPLALVFIGIIMVIAGARNTQAALAQLLLKDFTGPGNFTYWLVALGGIGSIGFIEPLRPVSRVFMILLIVSFVLKNGGVFDQLNQALQQGPIEAPKGNDMEASTSANSSGVTVQDHTAEYVGGVAQSAQASISASAANRANASKNFGTVASFVTDFLV